MEPLVLVMVMIVALLMRVAGRTSPTLATAGWGGAVGEVNHPKIPPLGAGGKGAAAGGIIAAVGCVD